MVYLGAYGPLRPEEQAELRRKGIDLDNLTARVKQAAPELTVGKRAEVPTKSEAGKRLLRSSSHRAHPDDSVRGHAEGNDGARGTVHRAGLAHLSAF